MAEQTDPGPAEFGSSVRRAEGPERELARAEVLHGLFGRSSPVVRWGRYRLRRCIGLVTRGVVYEAHDPRSHRIVALTRLVALEPTAAAALVAQAVALTTLRHRNVLEVHDVGTRGSEPYLATELMAGDTLDVVLSRLPQPVPWRDVVAKFVEIAAGLAAIHDAGLVHGDVTPRNVLLGVDGGIKIANLGLAFPISDRASEALAPYFAPEQRRGDAIDGRADQYSFFFALFEALCARPPYPVGSEGRVEIVWPKTFVGPSRLRNAIARGLAPVPADRFASMREVATILRRCGARRARWPLAVAFVALAGGWWLGPPSSPSCVASTAMEGVWDEARRVALRARPWTSRTMEARIEHRLDLWAADWIDHSEAACRSSTQEDDARRTCLQRQRDAFATRIEVLLDPSTPTEHALEAIADLPRPASCTDGGV